MSVMFCNQTNRAPIVAGLLSFAYASAVFAHHGNSEYDLTVSTRYEGVVVEFLWRNPHILTTLETTTATGKPITLEIEGGSPSILRTGGLTADAVVKGERVTVLVSPSRRFPEKTAYGYEIIKQDGTVIPLVGTRVPRPQVDQSAADIFTTWVPSPEMFTQVTQALRTWELTEKGRGIREQYSPAMSPQANCIPVSAPVVMTYPTAIQFQRSTTHVTIESDWMNAKRTVYLDGRAHPPSVERFPQGHSVGRFEGAVLVVDTTNFADQVVGGLPSGQSKHLVERFALAQDGQAMHYAFVWEDPEYLTQPVSGSGQMSFRPDLQLGGIDCDREAAQRFLKELQ